MNCTIEVASVPDRDDVVAEIWWGDAMVAELRHGTSGGAEIEIYLAESYAPWSFDLASWLAALRRLSGNWIEPVPQIWRRY